METNFSPVYLDNLPPDVNRNQCFTGEQLHRIPEDFSLEEELLKNAGKPPFPADTDVRQIQIFIDQRLGFSWDDGYITFQLYLPADFVPQSTVYTINGELASVLANGQYCFDRTQNIDTQAILNKSNAASERERRLRASRKTA